ncbi:glycosyl transferase, group 2 family domain protein [Wolbachia endosymbiont of Brugia pahangi]|nr:glycosyl transferase, group 2 family domain protein [Wolbachia endosymbiont of Brugia pahangi]
MGYKTKIIDLKTLEESPTTMFSWIKKNEHVGSNATCKLILFIKKI